MVFHGNAWDACARMKFWLEISLALATLAKILGVLSCSIHIQWTMCLSSRHHLLIWGFPKTGVPLNHPCSWDFPLETIHLGVPPFIETPHICKPRQRSSRASKIRAFGPDASKTSASVASAILRTGCRQVCIPYLSATSILA